MIDIGRSLMLCATRTGESAASGLGRVGSSVWEQSHLK
jgi:hypothetical protein